jgi:hypothetical protein
MLQTFFRNVGKKSTIFSSARGHREAVAGDLLALAATDGSARQI